MKRALLACTILSIAVPELALAQNPNIEEIVVTARKRTENLIDVPVSITAFTANEIAAAQLTEIRDLARLTPSFNFSDLGARYIDSPTIRGVAGNDADPTKQSASFFLDGVYISGSATSINMQDVERVEVIKGPQSALFGRSTFAGAINFITKSPGNEPSGSFTATGAEHDEYEVTFGGNMPLVEDKVFVRANGRYWTYGGEWTNAGIPRGISIGGQSTWNVGGTVLFKPSDALEAKVRIEHAEDDDEPAPINKKVAADQNCTFRIAYICGEVKFDPTRVGGTFDELIAEGNDPGLQRDITRGSAQFDYDFGGISWSGIAAYSDENMVRGWDVIFDLVKNPIFIGFGGSRPGTNGGQIINDWTFKDWSAETRLQSSGEGQLNWIAGLSYADLDQKFGRTRGAIAVDPPNRRTVKGWATFGQVEFKSGPFKASAEGRYQEETLKRLNITTGQVLTLGGGVLADRTFKTFLPRVTFDYKPSESTTLYAQWAKGNKPGDFNTVLTVAPEFVVLDEEKIQNFEAGLKGQALDNALTYSLAAFYLKLSNQQVRDTTPSFQLLTRNTGRSRAQGFEAEVSVAATENLSFRGAFGYADHQFTNFPNEANGANILGNGNAKGKTTRSTPKYTGSVSSTYRAEFNADLDWFARGDMVYRSKIFGDETNLNWAGTLVQVNLRAGLEADSWKVEVFGKNIFDDDTPQRIGIATDFSRFPIASPQTVSLIPSRGQQFGVRASYDF
jgi:iron complex outermembrane recepter protein